MAQDQGRTVSSAQPASAFTSCRGRRISLTGPHPLVSPTLAVPPTLSASTRRAHRTRLCPSLPGWPVPTLWPPSGPCSPSHRTRTRYENENACRSHNFGAVFSFLMFIYRFSLITRTRYGCASRSHYYGALFCLFVHLWTRLSRRFLEVAGTTASG